MPDEQAASLFLTYQTGHVGLHRRARLQPGEVVLVHAGAGGVGSAAIQLAKAAGATVIATSGGPEKVAVCRQLGADHAIDYLAEDFVGPVKEITGGRGADVIYDPVGGDVFDRSRKCIAFEGSPMRRPITRWSRTTALSGCIGASTGLMSRRSSQRCMTS
jgi:NADPH2:quinone reductase